MQRFRSWLSATTEAVKSGSLGPNGQKPLRIVLGNTSCDMDSAIGALCLAYLYSRQNADEVHVPVINCNRASFFTNIEIVKHLQQCQIPQEHLYFYDEFKAQFPDPNSVEEVALIDHNCLDPTQNALDSKVTRVVDHHVDSGAYAGQLKHKTCHLAGSACSFVALMWKENQALLEEDLTAVSDPSQPCNFASLLAAAVVLDSYFFKPELKDKKWTDEDTQAHQWLSQFADVGHDYWKVLNDAKFDV